MSEFLLLHDNESGGKPATVRKSIISSILPSEDDASEYPSGLR